MRLTGWLVWGGWQGRVAPGLLSVLAMACQAELVAPPRPQPVPPIQPVSLVAEAALQAPSQFWSALRREVGDPARPFPEHLALVLTQLLGISPALSGRIEADQPAYAAWAAGDAGLEWVFAFKVNSGREWVAELATGGDARFRKRENGRVTHLDGALALGAMGVVRNYVVVGSSVIALDTLGPYAARVRAEPPSARGLHVTSPVVGAMLEAGYQRWASSLRDVLVAAASEQARGADDERSLASMESGIEQLSAGVSDALGDVEGLQLDLEVERGTLALHGRFRTQAEDAEEPPEVHGLDLCAALRRLPVEVVAAAAFTAGLPDGSVETWLHAAGLRAASRAATEDVAGPVVVGWLKEAERRAILVSFAASDGEHVQRRVRAWFERPPAQVELVKGVWRWKNAERMRGTEHSLEVAWAFAEGRGYVALGASLTSFWSNLLEPSRTARDARQGLDGGCTRDARTRLWVEGLGSFGLTTQGGTGEFTGQFPIANIAHLFRPEPAP